MRIILKSVLLPMFTLLLITGCVETTENNQYNVIDSPNTQIGIDTSDNISDVLPRDFVIQVTDLKVSQNNVPTLLTVDLSALSSEEMYFIP